MDEAIGGLLLIGLIGLAVLLVRIFLSEAIAIVILELWAAYYAYGLGVNENSLLVGLFIFVCLQALVGLFYFASRFIEEQFFK